MFLKNKNIIFKIRRSKVTDYAALKLDRTVMEFTLFFESEVLLKKTSFYTIGISTGPTFYS